MWYTAIRTLLPETSTNETVGVQWDGADAYVRVQGYTNRFSQFIESVQLADSSNVQQFSYANVAAGVTRGDGRRRWMGVQADSRSRVVRLSRRLRPRDRLTNCSARLRVRRV